MFTAILTYANLLYIHFIDLVLPTCVIKHSFVQLKQNCFQYETSASSMDLASGIPMMRYQPPSAAVTLIDNDTYCNVRNPEVPASFY